MIAAGERVAGRGCSEFITQRELDLAGRRGGLRYGAELRCVDKPIWSPKVRVVQRIEKFRSKLDCMGILDAKFANKRKVQTGEPRPNHGIPADIPKRECRRGAKG